MGGSMADLIEAYLKELLRDNPHGIIEIRRRELADQFRCVPSQINYVLETRFPFEKGYLVESRRGGGGYIRIMRLQWRTERDLFAEIAELISDAISAQRAEELLIRLVEARILEEREAIMLRGLVEQSITSIEPEMQDRLRATLLRNLLIVTLRR
ncbi:MAG: CtsR family transcriptional regulator [Firmicutes bacterium]|jgi:transcriptional regulator CtsR|nr:CtsR family transcriptional regulator [Bacillota bacterium]HOB22597.1 CtsR family transcriptional regulator [Bacillota bacterium]HQD39218.1 CtsR family transcriptional regulator [Bacillota bacterium]